MALTIAEKVNTRQKIKVADIDELDIMITELDPEENIFSSFKGKGMQIL